MFPTQAAEAVRAAQNAAPNGKTVAVSKPGSPGVFDQIVNTTKAYAKVGLDVVGDIFGPSDFNVPGTAPIARALSKSVVNVGDAAATGIKDAAASATEGVKAGFKWGVLILVLVVGIWVWSVIKPRS